VLLADEPTANLDSQVGSQVLELSRLARRQKPRLLIVTHDPRVRASVIGAAHRRRKAAPRIAHRRMSSSARRKSP